MHLIRLLSVSLVFMLSGCCAHQQGSGHPATTPPPAGETDEGCKLPAVKAPGSQHWMDFQCACGKMYLRIGMVAKGGYLRGFLGLAKPEEIASVAFFLDGGKLADSPSAQYEKVVTIALPPVDAVGNLFLRLKDGTQVWANLGNNGKWKIKGAKKSGKGYLAATDSCE